MTTLPTGTLTFLFTDIEGSTRLWERYPEAMRGAVARHDSLLRACVEENHGALVKTTGDGLLAVFTDAADAVAALVAGQRALLAEAWGESGPLRVRMALHTGNAELRGGDYHGPAINRAARLMALAHGGQMLLSGTTADLVRERLQPELTLRELGEQRLKDVALPERVAELVAPGLPADFPPLNPASGCANNLPVQLTSFVGRERERAEIKRLLATTRLLTLTGPGGTGKTRLSLQVAAEICADGPAARVEATPAAAGSLPSALPWAQHEAASRLAAGSEGAAHAVAASQLLYSAGVWLVELAPLADPALLPQRIAALFSLREQPGRTMLEVLGDYLRAKQMLLLLDNCEHLIEACAQVADTLLRTCTRLTILASSREALGIAGETAYSVPSLSCPSMRDIMEGLAPIQPGHGVGTGWSGPSAHASAGLDASAAYAGQDTAASRAPAALPFEEYDAIRLFTARAGAVQPHFALTAQNAPAVVQICQRLDGIPLAIELATARMKLFSAEQIAARLDDRFRLLTGGSRTALPRQQTLQALIDWSYDLLSEPERILLRRLSVFAGGWSFEAAEEVTKDEGGRRKGESSKSLPDSERGIEGDIQPSAFSLDSTDVLDLLSQLVNKSLVAVDEQQSADGSVRYRFLETVRQYARDKLLASGESTQVRDRHLAWFLRFAEAAGPKLFGREMLVWMRRLDVEHDNFRAALEWGLSYHPDAALRLAGTLYFFWLMGYVGEGRDWLRKALAAVDPLAVPRADTLQVASAARAVTDKAALARALMGLGTLTFGLGDYLEAQRLFEQSLALAREIGDRSVVAAAMGIYSRIQLLLGDWQGAQDSLMEGIAAAQSIDAKYYAGILNRGLVLIAQKHRGDADAARRYAAEGLRLAREVGNPFLLAMALGTVAFSSAARGEPGAARAHFRESRALLNELGNRQGANSMQSEVAHLTLREGDYVQAARLYRESIKVWHEMGQRGGLARCMECLAFIAAAQADPLRAARLLGVAEAMREAGGARMTYEEQPEYDRELTALRAQLDAAAFADAWAAGRALGEEQALALALEEKGSA